MRRRNKVLSFDAMETRTVLDGSLGGIPPVSVEMPSDESLYPGPDIDQTEEQRKAIESTFSEIIRESLNSEPYTGPIPEFPPPTVSGETSSQSYYEWMIEVMQKAVEAISPPDHPIMITP